MAEAMTKDKWLIDPRTSRVMPVWDMIMLMSLLFTTLVSPYEVSAAPHHATRRPQQTPADPADACETCRPMDLLSNRVRS
eukprot:4076225-Prymnesium_polylepis.2